MKKQVFYKLCKDRENKSLYFEKAMGYIYDLTDIDGKPFKVALEWRSPVWTATEITTGLSFSPITDKNKLELLKKLSLHQVNKILQNEHNQIYSMMLRDHKESETSQ